MKLKINNKYSTLLPADPEEANGTRQVTETAFSYMRPTVPSKPELIHFSKETAALIGLTETDAASPAFTAIFSGKDLLEGTRPYAMSYAGHQFGNWAGQLGDGRAIVLTEIDVQNKNYTLQLKGAGPTPYSRRADGMAVLRSSIREHLCSEAMFHLGVPTTRSLSLLLTGDQVLRDVMYDGHAEYEKGAVVCRVAPSFIRFGNFELFASQNDIPNLKKLADFTIEQYYPEIKGDDKTRYAALFEAVANNTRKMIVQWQRVGFVHGVMNTDNMSILGLTIDYGPYGWLEDYNPDWTPNTTDRENRRYRYGNQPQIALWNLYQLANALYPLIEEAAPLETVLQAYQDQYEADYTAMMNEKLGLAASLNDTKELIGLLSQNLLLHETDMTIFFRLLAQIKQADDEELAFKKISDAFYNLEKVSKETKETWLYWFTQYITKLKAEKATDAERAIKMNQVNPKYVLRNYMAQLAIDLAEKGDYSLITEFYELLKKPYDEQEAFSNKWFAKRPDWARQKIGSSMLSCSS